MNALCWNCRCLGNTPAIWELRAIIRGSHVDYLLLQETKVSLVVLQGILRLVGFVSMIHVPPVVTTRGLCIAWQDGPDLEPVFMSKNAIS